MAEVKNGEGRRNTALVWRNIVIVLAVLALPILVIIILVGDGLSHMMFRPYEDQLKDLLEPPLRVRMVGTLAAIYLPVTALVVVLHLAAREPEFLRAAGHGTPTGTDTQATRRGLRTSRLAWWCLVLAVLAGSAYYLRLTPEERVTAEQARERYVEETAPLLHAVVSPSGSVLARGGFSDYHDHSTLHLNIEPLNEASGPGLDGRRLLQQSGQQGDGLVLSWDGDTHLTVAGVHTRYDGRIEMPSGPDHLGAIRVSYQPFVFGEFSGHQAVPVSVSEVSYSLEEAKARWAQPHGNWCALRVQGLDAVSHRRVGITLAGFGDGDGGASSGPYFIPYVLVFDSVDLAGAAERLTLTQGTLKDLPPAPPYVDGVVSHPFQADVLAPADQARPDAGRSVRQTVAYPAILSEERVKAMFDRFRVGRYEAVLEFGLGRKVVAYAFDAPIPRPVAEAFQACEAATRISRPLAGPRLTQEAPAEPP